MARRALLTAIAGLGIALSATAGLGLPQSPPPAGIEPGVARSIEPVPAGDRSLFRAGDAFFERHARGGSRSLFRPYRFQFGPHYQPPAVTYRPPAVVYEPPLERERSRCAPQTRAWYRSCAARYRSFDPYTGTYTTYSGQERVCRCP